MDVAVNAAGLRIGQDHQCAKLTDAEVELIRALHEEGMEYQVLAEKFDISRWTIGRICRYEIRAQVPVRTKRVLQKPLNTMQWRKQFVLNGYQGELEL